MREQVCNLFPNVYYAGTGLQPVPERFGLETTLKHEGRGCKPRPA